MATKKRLRHFFINVRKLTLKILTITLLLLCSNKYLQVHWYCDKAKIYKIKKNSCYSIKIV